MSSRKNRLSLSSDARKDAGGKTSCRTPVRKTHKSTKHSDARANDDSCEVSPSQGADYSPVIPLTQDNSFHAINGVSWKWNSPQRFHGQIRMKAADVRKSNHKPLLKLKHSEMPAEAPKEATGFNKFISKLNLLMGKENVSENVPDPAPVGPPVDTLSEENEFHTADQGQREEQAHIVDSDDLFKQHFCLDSDDERDIPIDKAERRPTESIDAFEQHQFIDDELDDSKLDRILIEASQTVEQKLNNPSLPPPTVVPKRGEPDISIPFEMNDSDMDGFLVQASLMVEEKLSDSSQESTSHKLVANGKQIGSVTVQPSHINKPQREEEKKLPELNLPTGAAVADTSEIRMTQGNLKALLEKKRQEALLRLQNNRLKRAMKGTSSNG